MNMKFIFLMIISTFFSSEVFALVDYSEATGSAPVKKSRPVLRSKKKSAPKSVSSGPASSYTPSGMFDLGVNYKSIDVKSEDTFGKVTVMEVEGHFSTNFNVFFDFKYWTARTNEESLSENSGNQNGNPEVLLGFIWLQFGGPEDGTSVDLLGGVRFKSTSSDLGSTRTDKIFGVETVKSFYTFALGLGYRLYMTGTPEDEQEVDFGNIQKLYASFGWMVSSDIQFEVEGAAYTIGESSSVSRSNVLENKESFGTVSPKLSLGLSPMINLSLGATFRTDKVTNTEKLIQARLWDMSGVYGSSIQVGLGITL